MIKAFYVCLYKEIVLEICFLLKTKGGVGCLLENPNKI